MKKILSRILPKVNKWDFRKADLIESTEQLKNPARGWYQIYTFAAEDKSDFEKISWCGELNDTLALIIIDIGAYKERKLDQKALKNIKSILRFFSEKKLDIILRITYDHEGNALEREPFFFSVVREHLEQVSEIVSEFADKIFVFQGMLIGNWGEMHTSRFLYVSKLGEMWSILHKELEGKLFFAVRRPAYWRQLHPQACQDTNFSDNDMGLFDDAILGSESHLGTFGVKTKEVAGWDGIWCKQDELDFEDKLCRYVPNGGEAVCGDEYPQEGNPNTTAELFKKMHITYLNREYDTKILDIWKNWKWNGAGVWQNVSFYDYISTHLGYRFWIKNVGILESKQNAKKLLVTITVENVGFANFYHEGEVILSWIDAQGNENAVQLDCDIRNWNSQETKELCCEIEAINCKLFLSARRKKDGRAIYFSNKTKEDKKVFLGEILNIHN